MKNHIWIFMIMFILFSNCTTIHNVKQKPISFSDEFKKAAKGRKGHILLTNNQTFIGYNIQMSQDSTSWLEEVTGGEYYFSKEFSIRSKNVGKIRVETEFRVLVGSRVGFILPTNRKSCPYV